MINAILFLIGLCVGSFLGVVIDRFPKKSPILYGRSSCDFCKHQLAWYDLIPLFSFLFLLGKCRYCGKKLSFWYPGIELLTAMVFVGLFVAMRPMSFLSFLLYVIDLALITTGIILSAIDYSYQLLPDTLLVVLGIFSLLLLLLSGQNIGVHILIGFMSCIPLFLIFLVTKGKGMGFGDVKLSFVMGLLLGYPSILVAYYIAFLTGGITSLLLVITKKKKLHGGTIAFGPFLLLGTFLGLFFGQQLWISSLKLLGF